MKIGLAQINTTVGDFSGNLEKILKSMEQGRAAGVDLVVFPEQVIPGYPAEDLLEREDFVRRAQEVQAEVQEATRGGPAAVVGNLVPSHLDGGKRIHNSAVFLQDGQVAGIQHKSLLPTYDVFDEARYFQPAADHRVFEFRGMKIGLAICEDVWNDPEFWSHRIYPVDPVEELVKNGARILVVISASPFSMGGPRFRLRMMQNTVRRHGIHLIYVNQVGGNTTLIFDGTSLALTPQGDLIARARGFEEDFTVADLERKEPLVLEADDEVANGYSALVLGTRDYLRKTGFSKVVVGLSGGIDSALTAVIARDAVGPENVIGLSMPSRYSSPGSETDARALAERLGITFHRIPIEDMFSASLSTLNPIFQGLPEDTTEENIQARLRGLILMAISNKMGALLLSTGNKSEVAVGYCTLYGDMCGGLAVISDVPKTMVYAFSHYVNRSGEVIPYSIIQKPPSAELKPDQTDQDTLPPYGVLDSILESYIEKGLDRKGIMSAGYPPDLVDRVIRMVDLAEYKRKQAAPGLRITSKAFGPGRRFPIVQKYRPKADS